MTWFVCLNTKTEKCLNCKSDLNVRYIRWTQMKTLQVGLKCLHYMFDVNVDKFDSTHVHEQFDSQG